MVIDTEYHTVSSRKLKVKQYGLAQTFGGHYAIPIAEFSSDQPPLHDPEVPSHVEAIPVYHSVRACSDKLLAEPGPPSQTSALRSWTRQDKGVPCTLGTGRNGPAWDTVIRRTVYDSATGEQILDEDVHSSTLIRQPLPRPCDTTTILMYRASGSLKQTTSSNSSMPSLSEESRKHGLPASSARPRQDHGGHLGPGRRLQQGPERFVRLESGGRGRGRPGEGDIGQAECYEGTNTQGLDPGETHQGANSLEGASGKGKQGSGQGREDEASIDALATHREDGGNILGGQRCDGHGDRCATWPADRVLREAHQHPRREDQVREAADPSSGHRRGSGVCQGSNEGVLGGEDGTPRASGGVAEDGDFHRLPGAGQAVGTWRERLEPGIASKFGGCPTSEILQQERGERRDKGSLSKEEELRAGQPDERERSLPQYCPLAELHDGSVQVEDDGVDVEGASSDLAGNGAQVSVEAKSTVAHDDAGEAVSLHVGTPGSPTATLQQSEALPLHDGGDAGTSRGRRRPSSQRPSRGLHQKLKQGVHSALASLRLLTLVASAGGEFSALEIFPSGSSWISMASRGGWTVTGPLHPVRQPPDMRACRKIFAEVTRQKPDVVMMDPPTGPWTTWKRDGAELEEKKDRYFPMWWLIYRIWEFQTKNGSLVVLKRPAKVVSPGPDELRGLALRCRHLLDAEGLSQDWQLREDLYYAHVDMCAFGLKDTDSGKPMKQSCVAEVNDPFFCSLLEKQASCQHERGAHVVVQGTLRGGGARKELAATWPAEWGRRVLESAQDTLQQRRGAHMSIPLHEQSGGGRNWETVPVEVENTPEGLLRQRLGEVTGQRYDYIYFEGASGALSKQLRSTLAKLHVVLGHVSAEKLKRMLHLSGAKDHVLNAVNDLRCQVCQSVVPPSPSPKVSFDKPQRFNQRVLSDTFFIWDCRGEKFAVVHAIDAFSLYQIALTGINPRADWTAQFLKNRWFSVFGPPEIFMTDAGTEYAGDVESLMRAFNVHHEVVPPGAKWRMGLAERHGAVLKLLAMKTIKEVTAKGYHEVSQCVLSAVAARNRQVRVGGFAPTQIVLGKDVAISSSLLEQLESGHFKYVVNQDLSFDQARRRNEQIRQAAEAAFIWADSCDTLRKAINAKSRSPKLECLYEGATVYFWNPPNSRRGLPKRLQDQDAWSGPELWQRWREGVVPSNAFGFATGINSRVSPWSTFDWLPWRRWRAIEFAPPL